MSWDTFYDPHPPTLMQQYWLADTCFFVITSTGRWIGWGYNKERDVDVHMNGRFVNLTRITSNKS